MASQVFRLTCQIIMTTCHIYLSDLYINLSDHYIRLKFFVWYLKFLRHGKTTWNNAGQSLFQNLFHSRKNKYESTQTFIPLSIKADLIARFVHDLRKTSVLQESAIHPNWHYDFLGRWKQNVIDKHHAPDSRWPCQHLREIKRNLLDLRPKKAA